MWRAFLSMCWHLEETEQSIRWKLRETSLFQIAWAQMPTIFLDIGMVDLFSLYFSFSHSRPRDVLMGIFPLFPQIVRTFCTCVRLFPTIASRGVKWESRTYKLKSLFVAASFDFMAIVLVLKPCILTYFGLYNQLDSQVLCILTFIIALALLLGMSPPN